MLHARRFWRGARWPAASFTLLILIAWVTSTRWAVSKSFNDWGIESFGGLIVLRQWEGGGPAYQTSEDAVTEALGHFGWELPVFSLSRFGIGYLSIPYWVLFLPAAVVALIAFWRAGTTYPVGCCPACGYSLRGSPSGKCPECGSASTGNAQLKQV